MVRPLSALCSLALALFTSCSQQTEERQPDVLLLVIDTLRADHLGCYGYERPTSPVIDEIAERGVIFKNNSSLSSLSAMAKSPQIQIPRRAMTAYTGRDCANLNWANNSTMHEMLAEGRRPSADF